MVPRGRRNAFDVAPTRLAQQALQAASGAPAASNGEKVRRAVLKPRAPTPEAKPTKTEVSPRVKSTAPKVSKLAQERPWTTRDPKPAFVPALKAVPPAKPVSKPASARKVTNALATGKAKEPAKEPAREPSEEPAREPAGEPAKELAREPAVEPARAAHRPAEPLGYGASANLEDSEYSEYSEYSDESEAEAETPMVSPGSKEAKLLLLARPVRKVPPPCGQDAEAVAQLTADLRERLRHKKDLPPRQSVDDSDSDAGKDVDRTPEPIRDRTPSPVPGAKTDGKEKKASRSSHKPKATKDAPSTATRSAEVPKKHGHERKRRHGSSTTKPDGNLTVAVEKPAHRRGQKLKLKVEQSVTETRREDEAEGAQDQKQKLADAEERCSEVAESKDDDDAPAGSLKASAGKRQQVQQARVEEEHQCRREEPQRKRRRDEGGTKTEQNVQNANMAGEHAQAAVTEDAENAKDDVDEGEEKSKTRSKPSRKDTDGKADVEKSKRHRRRKPEKKDSDEKHSRRRRRKESRRDSSGKDENSEGQDAEEKRSNTREPSAVTDPGVAEKQTRLPLPKPAETPGCGNAGTSQRTGDRQAGAAMSAASRLAKMLEEDASKKNGQDRSKKRSRDWSKKRSRDRSKKRSRDQSKKRSRDRSKKRSRDRSKKRSRDRRRSSGGKISHSRRNSRDKKRNCRRHHSPKRMHKGSSVASDDLVASHKDMKARKAEGAKNHAASQALTADKSQGEACEDSGTEVVPSRTGSMESRANTNNDAKEASRKIPRRSPSHKSGEARRRGSQASTEGTGKEARSGGDTDAMAAQAESDILSEIESLKEMLAERREALVQASSNTLKQEVQKEIETLEEMLADREKALLHSQASRKSSATEDSINEGGGEQSAAAKVGGNVNEEGAEDEASQQTVTPDVSPALAESEGQAEVESKAGASQPLEHACTETAQPGARLAIRADPQELERLKEALRRRGEEHLLKERQERQERQRFTDPLATDGDDVPFVVGPVSNRAPPAELPVWCVLPNLDDIVLDVELVRLIAKDPDAQRRVVLGRRSWIMLGRRVALMEEGAHEPDIGLCEPRASRSHAVILRNWTGKVFLMDLNSSCGSFLGNQRLAAETAVEWKVGVKAAFGGASTEVFELRVAKPPREGPVMLPPPDEAEAAAAAASRRRRREAMVPAVLTA